MAEGLFAGRYQLAELLGSGGMARVHRARDVRMGRTVAVKMLLAELAGDPGARRRFAREAQAAGALNHPGIVTVHDQDEAIGVGGVVPFLVMEYVQGFTLAELIREQGKLPPERAVRIACDVLDALAHAHSRGTVHRDVKPANVMITREGAVKVADFGIAWVLHSGSRLTTTGFAIGTPGYMSPEQIDGGVVDARSDIYGVGCVLVELLTGRPPFSDGNPLTVLYRHVHTPPSAPSDRNPLVPEELDRLVLAALAKDPAARPPTAAAYRDRLRSWLAAAAPAALTGPAAEPGTASGTGAAAGHGQEPASPPAGPPSDPRATFGVALPALPPAPARAVPDRSSPPAAAVHDAALPSPSPGPGAVRPEHPAYSRSPQVPLPPPYLPDTPQPFDARGRTGGVPALRPPDRGRGQRRWIVAGVVLALAGVGVGVTLALAPFGGTAADKGTANGGPPPTPTPTPNPTAAGRSLALHGGKEGSGYGGGIDGVVNPSDRTGGTLRLVSSYAPPDMLDPAASYDTTSWNLQRLYLRKLVDYAPAPGPSGREIVPDLATDTGSVSSDGLTWTFHLKPGLRFDNGAPITSGDVKYGIERTFDRALFQGPSYFVDLLDRGQHYPGPYKDSDPDGPGLKSVATPDATTVVFTLARPFADFRYVLALSAGAPIPRSADTGGGKDYEHSPVGSGPYKVADYEDGRHVRLVRNPYWKQSTDTIHSSLPDSVELDFLADQDAVEKALLDGSADLDVDSYALTPGTELKIRGDSTLKAGADLAYSGATRFISLQTSVAPFGDYQCRRAVQYAVDRVAVQTAFGGGDIATTMLPPTADGHDPAAAPYNTAAGQPSLDKARSQLTACGKAGGFGVTLAGLNNTKSVAAMHAISQALGRVGITVKVESVDVAPFYDTLASPAEIKKKNWGMLLTSWAADWPTGGGFLRALVEPGSAYDYSGLDDPDINNSIEAADTRTDPVAGAGDWKAIDKKVMAEATLVPLLWERHLVYRGPRLTNAYEHQVLGGIDLTALGVER